jgi:hypothetical protein
MRPGRRGFVFVMDEAGLPPGFIPPSAALNPPPQVAAPAAPQGWQCPSCRRVYAPWVACCGTCPEADEPSREIHENRP